MIKRNYEMVKCGECRFFVETQQKLGHGECRENSPGVNGWPGVTRTDCCGRGERLVVGIPEKAFIKPPVFEVKVIGFPDTSGVPSSEPIFNPSNIKNDIKNGVKEGIKGLAREDTQAEGVAVIKRVQELMEDAPEFEKPEDWK